MPLQLTGMAELATALADDALLLVPNYRSSDQLTDQLCRYRQQSLGGTVFRRPPIRAIDLWLRESWEQLAQLHAAPKLHWRVLQPAEEQLLWQQLVQQAAPELLLLNRDGTASAAAEAWRLLQQWQLPLATLRRHLNQGGNDTDKDDREYAFLWLQAFERHCDREQLLTFSGMLQQLLGFIENGTLRNLQLLPATLIRYGFDKPPPLYDALFTALRTQGVNVTDWRFEAMQPQLQLRQYSVPADECRAATEWAQAILQQDGHASIGIITADSDVLRGELHRCFDQSFTAAPGQFSATLSASLAEAPYVHTALASLMLLLPDIDTLQCCALLRSPWLLAADSEQDARAALEIRLRSNEALQWRCVDVRELSLMQQKPWHCPLLGSALLELQQRLLRQSARQPLPMWVVFFESCWDLLVPRKSLLDSGDKVLVKAWEGVLKQVQLGSVAAGELDFAAAIAVFTRLCRATTLASGRTQAPIQLLTPVMAAGLHFSHLWCMQMTEALWPGEQQPHPYLPLALQRQHALPGTDRQHNLQQSSELLQGLIDRTTQQLVFSHATSSDDLPQRASGLLPVTQQPAGNPPAAAGSGLHPAIAQLPPAIIEVVQDSTTVPLPATVFNGGSGILTSQSACPFKAFAEYRLQARRLETPSYGIPPRALGDCVHAALQAFWTALQSHAQLLTTSDAGLQQIIRTALKPALNSLARSYPSVMTPRLLMLEEERLAALLVDWLNIERQRGEFRVIATERQLLCAVSRLQLNLRLDRIDLLADGSSAIVDYKTGSGSISRWQDERPAAPQLLLYQLAADATDGLPPTTALLHAHINVELLSYSGIAANDSVYPGLGFADNKSVDAPDWPTLKQQWQQIIARLADEFLQGYAAVQPARRDSCTYCHLASLCRIGERADAAETSA